MNKRYKNTSSKMLKQNGLVQRQNSIINGITNKLKTNNSVTVSVDKSNAIVIAYTNYIK